MLSRILIGVGALSLKRMPLNPLSDTVIPEGVLEAIALAIGSEDVVIGDTLQSLWSGYGGIIELQLNTVEYASAVLKLINPPQQENHPRGWDTDRSRQRKLRSYQIESHWYERYAGQCNDRCRVPAFIAADEHDSMRWMLLENLNAAFPARAMNLSIDEAKVCLRWLAAFHSRFLGQTPNGLWPIGTYWHLDTRADELEAMSDKQLKSIAKPLDTALNSCEFQTIVHGDAKVANFCFNADYSRVSAVDFQYVGGGVGIKDVAYFLGSCIDEASLQSHESELLAAYFDCLRDEISRERSADLAEQVVHAWSNLYAIAWTDFYRFLQGWSPTHHKVNSYTRLLAERAFSALV